MEGKSAVNFLANLGEMLMPNIIRCSQNAEWIDVSWSCITPGFDSVIRSELVRGLPWFRVNSLCKAFTFESMVISWGS